MKTEITTGLCVSFEHAEKVRKFLWKKKILREDLKIIKDRGFIYFPIKVMPRELASYSIIKKRFEKKEKQPKSYKELVSIPENLKQDLPTSYDIIGDIILIKLSKKLLSYQKEIGISLLTSNKHIRTICIIEPITGELRTRQIQVIAGEKRTTTIHTEYGLTFNVDVQTTYFSPRLAQERERVATLVKPGETIVDMFAGVAPFSIMIAKYAQPKIIYAIDKNKDAVILAKRNVVKNNVLDKIEVIHGDAKKIDNILHETADRIIMNLPFSAHRFFLQALHIAKDICTIHYYDILKEEKIQERIDMLKKLAEENKTILIHVDVQKMKTYAPREFYIGIDITAKKDADVA